MEKELPNISELNPSCTEHQGPEGKGVGNIRFVKSLGRGSFGEVFRAFRQHQYSAESGEGENTDLVEPVAVKVIQKHERIRTTKETRLLENEIGTLKRLQDHPNVVRFISAEYCHTALEWAQEFRRGD